MAKRSTFQKRWLKMRNRLFARFLETRYGRELLVNALPRRILSMTTDCGDHVLTFSPHDYIGRKVYRKGQFERGRIHELTEILRAEGMLRQGAVLLEIGGNIGTQTIYWARTEIFRHILSIEADPRNFRLLSRNIADNDLTETVTLVQAAAGDRSGLIGFFQNPDNHGKSATRRTSPRDVQIEVAVRPVIDILAEQGLAAPDIGLIWMDIEGFEPAACRGMLPLIEARVPLYLEFSPQYYGADAAAFRTMLAGYYRRAILFEEDRAPEVVTPAGLPLDRGQYDVLLLA